MERLLVIGGRGGIGSAVVQQAKEVFDVTVAEQDDFDLDNGAQIASYFRHQKAFDHVVCAAGVNPEGGIRSMGLHRQMLYSAQVNYIGPMIALQAWCKKAVLPGHFVFISSNSAHVARSRSVAYCASKAALSMAIRCAARELGDSLATVWGVEPGWVEDTPMSRQVLRRLDGAPAHRIPGDRTQSAEDVADFITVGIISDKRAYNGCLFRVDGGEQ